MQIVELAIQQPSGFECIPLLSKYKKARTCPRVTPPALLYTGGVGRWSSPHNEERFWLWITFRSVGTVKPVTKRITAFIRERLALLDGLDNERMEGCRQSALQNGYKWIH